MLTETTISVGPLTVWKLMCYHTMSVEISMFVERCVPRHERMYPDNHLGCLLQGKQYINCVALLSCRAHALPRLLLYVMFTLDPL